MREKSKALFQLPFSPNLCLAAWQVLKSLYDPAHVATSGAVERSGDGGLGGPRVPIAFTHALAVDVAARCLAVVVLRLRLLGQRMRQRMLAVVVLRLLPTLRLIVSAESHG